MTPTKIRTLFISSALAILALALSFGAVLSTGSFKKSLTESYVSSFVINGSESVRKIEYALKYGKQLDNFFGIQSILQEVKSNNPDVKNVKIILADGTVAYSLTAEGPKVLPDRLVADMKILMRDGAKSRLWQVVDRQYNVLIEIRDPSGEAIGAMDVVFDEAVIKPHADAFERSIMKVTIIVGVLAALILALLLWRTEIVDPATGKLHTTRLLVMITLVIATAQSVLTAQAIFEFQPVFMSTVQKNHQLVGELVKKNVEKVVAKGIPYSELEKLDQWMNAIPKAMPEIEGIVLTNKADSTPLYSTRRTDGIDNSKYLSSLDPKTVTRAGLGPDSLGVKADAVIALSTSYIESRNRAIIIDALTLLVTTILFSVEIVIFLGIYLRRQAAASAAGVKAALLPSDVSIVRPQAFVLFLAASMATSFLPVILYQFEPIAGLTQNIFLGLPLTVELFASIISTIVTGIVLDRRGWRPPFLAGLLILGTGTLLSAIATTTTIFLFARLIVGIGYGFAWMSLRGFVATSETEDSQTSGFAGLNSGIYAGINCGVILGALLVERLEYSGIFWMALVLTGIAIAFCLAFTTNLPVAPKAATTQRKQTPTSPVTDGNIWIFFLSVAIPASVCLMFLNYYVPVYSKAAGISGGDVGRLFLLYGLCVVYLGPVLSRTVIQKYSSKNSTAFGFLLVITGLVIFGFFPSPLTCTLAVALLGLSDGIGLVAQNQYYLSYKSVKDFGVGKSMGVFSIVKKIGQTLGPLIFGWLSLQYLGIGALGVVFAVALVVFVVAAPSTEKAARA